MLIIKNSMHVKLNLIPLEIAPSLKHIAAQSDLKVR
jgi:hypothetical protein